MNHFNRVSGSAYSYAFREQRGPEAAVKIPRTYGWLCPFDNYKSEKHFNTQRHINLRHGYGSGEPIDSLSGLTREQKRRNASGRDTSSIKIHGNNFNTNSSYRPLDKFQLRYNSGNSQSHASNQNAIHMPFLNDATKRVGEFGYCQNVPAGVQMINNIPNGAACVTGRAPNSILPDFQPPKGMIPANLPHPNLKPNPYPYIPPVSYGQYPLSNNVSEATSDVHQNSLAQHLAIYNLMKERS
jgi:hypothetical protein